ncbi:methyl-accepting chemotaxis protein [Salinibius halmophilus]|uniref:methyl-accepting chemotaxis protein n=1 Tax=Salinibius halmophilus TaxID=1853216 RepID=UPI000E6662A7|nr:methyl-accepting chemotaxis protein [Salinibius halmophilus]
MASLANRVLVGFAIIALFVIVLLVIALRGTGSLVNGVQQVTGPAWDTADGAMESTIGVQQEIIAIERLLAGADPRRSLADKDSAQALTTEAFSRLTNANLMDAQAVEGFQSRLQAYRDLANSVTQSYQQYRQSKAEFDVHAKQFVELSQAMEEAGDSVFEQFSANPDQVQLLSWNSGLKDKWQTADGAMESNIGILGAFYYLELFVQQSMPADEAEAKIREYLGFKNEAIGELSQTVFFSGYVPEALGQGTYAEVFPAMSETFDTLLWQVVDAARAYHQAAANYETLSYEILETLEQFEEEGDSKVEGYGVEIAGSAVGIQSRLVLVGIVVLAVVFVLMVLLFRSVMLPIRNLNSYMHGVSSGARDLTQRLPVKGNNELSQTARAFNGFVDQVQQVVNEAKLTARAVSEQASMLQSHLRELAQESEAQSQAITEINHVFTQLDDLVGQTAEAVEAAVAATREAEQFGSKGIETVQQTRESIQSLTAEISQAEGVVTQLSDAVASIDSILQAIQTVAEQTNLLALNAAIEAARAGEQGRGFAVVADEVRALAGKTSESTELIQQTTQSLRQRASSAVSTMQGCVNNAGSCLELSKGTEQTLHSTGEVLQTVLARTASIDDVAQHELSMSKNSMQSIAQMVAHNQRMSERMAHSSQSASLLDEHINELEVVVSKFKS